MAPLRLILLTTLSLGPAGAASVLPDRLPGLETLDPDLNRGARGSLLDKEADRHGLTCQSYRLFLYRNPAEATRTLNRWLASRGLQATPVEANDVTVQWRASDGRANLYGLWVGTDEGGRLGLCQGEPFDVAARTARRAQASEDLEKLSRALSNAAVDDPEEPRFRFPLWGAVLLGSAAAGWLSRKLIRSVWE